MAIKITGKYLGDKRVSLAHGPSSTEIKTVAPLDNGGDGSTFSPTDLVAAALASCVLTVLANVAERRGLCLEGMTVEIEKEMSGDSPRRIVALPLTVKLPDSVPLEERARLESAAHSCPVGHSLREEIRAPISFLYSS